MASGLRAKGPGGPAPTPISWWVGVQPRERGVGFRSGVLGCAKPSSTRYGTIMDGWMDGWWGGIYGLSPII